MSDNVIQSIEKVLSQQNNGLTQDEIKTICNQFSKKANPAELRWALTDNLEGKDARASLEAMMMYWVDNVELAAKVVVGSETTSADTDIKAVEAEIRYRDRHWGKDGNGWDRYDDNRDDTDSGSDPNNETNSNQEYTPQHRRSNPVSHPDHLDPDEDRRRNLRKDLFGI